MVEASVAGRARLLEVCERWTQERGRQRWTLELSPGRDPRVIERGRSGYTRLEPWQAGLWILVVEAAWTTRCDPAAMFLAIRPGWRVRAAVSSRSFEAARERVLALVQPRGEWRWDNEGVEGDIVGGAEPLELSRYGLDLELRYRYRGQLRWYEPDPAPAERAALAKVAADWQAHATEAGAWMLAPGPFRSPAPHPLTRMPRVGVWLAAYVEGRSPGPGTERAIAACIEGLL